MVKTTKSEAAISEAAKSETTTTPIYHVNQSNHPEDFLDWINDKYICTIGELGSDFFKPNISAKDLYLLNAKSGNRAFRREFLQRYATHDLLLISEKYFNRASYAIDAVVTLGSNLSADVSATPTKKMGIIIDTAVDLGASWGFESISYSVIETGLVRGALLIGLECPPILAATVAVGGSIYLLDKLWDPLWNNIKNSENIYASDQSVDSTARRNLLTHQALNINHLRTLDETQTNNPDILNLAKPESFPSPTWTEKDFPQLTINNKSSKKTNPSKINIPNQQKPDSPRKQTQKVAPLKAKSVKTRLNNKNNATYSSGQTDNKPSIQQSETKNIFVEHDNQRAFYAFRNYHYQPKDPVSLNSKPKHAVHVGFGSSSAENPGIGFTSDSANGVHHQSVYPDTTYYANLNSHGANVGVAHRTDDIRKLAGGAGAIIGIFWIIEFLKEKRREADIWDSLPKEEKAHIQLKETIQKHQKDLRNSWIRYLNPENWGESQHTISHKKIRNTFNQMEKFIGDLDNPELLINFQYMRAREPQKLNELIRNTNVNNVDSTLNHIMNYRTDKINLLTETAIEQINNNNYNGLHEIAVQLKMFDEQNPFCWKLFAKHAERSQQQNKESIVNDLYNKAIYFSKDSSQKQDLREERLKFNLESGDVTSVQQEFQEVLNSTNNNNFRRLCAETCLQRGAVSSAQFAYTTIVKNQSSSISDKCHAYLRLGEISEASSQNADITSKSEENDKITSRGYFKQAAEYKTTNLKLVHACTRKLRQYGAYEEAYESAKHGQQLAPESNEADLLVARCALSLGKIEEAANIATKHIGDDNDKDVIRKSHKILAQVEITRNTPDTLRKALLHSQEAEKLAPDDHQLIYQQAQINFALNDHQKAYENFTRYAEKYPAQPQVKYMRAVAALQSKNIDVAQGLFSELILDKTLEDTTIKSDAHRMLGHVAVGLGQEPLIHYRKAVEVHDKNYDAHNDLAMYFFQKEQYENARQHFHRCTENNEDTAAVAKVALVMFRLGNTEEARKLLGEQSSLLKKESALSSNVGTQSPNEIAMRYINRSENHDGLKIVSDLAFLILQQTNRHFLMNASPESAKNVGICISFISQSGIKEYLIGAWDEVHFAKLAEMESRILGLSTSNDLTKIPQDLLTKVAEDLKTLKSDLTHIPTQLSNLCHKPKEIFNLPSKKFLAKGDTILFFGGTLAKAMASHNFCGDGQTKKVLIATVDTVNVCRNLTRGAILTYRGAQQIHGVFKSAQGLSQTSKISAKGIKCFIANSKPGFKNIGNASLLFVQVADFGLDIYLAQNYKLNVDFQPDHEMLHGARAVMKAATSFDVGLAFSGACLLGPIAWGFFGAYTTYRLACISIELETRAKLANAALLIKSKNYIEAHNLLSRCEVINALPDDDDFYYIRLRKIEIYILLYDLNNADKLIKELEPLIRSNDKKEYLDECLHHKSFVEQCLSIKSLQDFYQKKQYEQALNLANVLIPTIQNQEVLRENKTRLLDVKLFAWLHICDEFSVKDNHEAALQGYKNVLIFLTDTPEFQNRRVEILRIICSQLLRHNQCQSVIDFTKVESSQGVDVELMLLRARAFIILSAKVQKPQQAETSSGKEEINPPSQNNHVTDNIEKTNKDFLNASNFILKDIITKEPKNIEANQLLAELALKAEDYVGAIAYLNIANSAAREKVVAMSEVNTPGNQAVPELEKLRGDVLLMESGISEIERWMDAYITKINQNKNELIGWKNNILNNLSRINRQFCGNSQSFFNYFPQVNKDFTDFCEAFEAWQQMLQQGNKLSPSKYTNNLRDELNIFSNDMQKFIMDSRLDLQKISNEMFSVLQRRM